MTSKFYRVVGAPRAGQRNLKAASSRWSRRGVLLALGTFTLAPAAHAHRSKSVFSSITWNPERSQLEVVHRLHTDDVEIGLAAYADLGEYIDLREIRNQARLMVYVEGHFALETDDAPLGLEPIGVELKGREVLVHQQVEMPAPPMALGVRNEILRDVFSGQTNLVNINLGGRPRTVLFSGRDGMKQIGKLF